MPIEPNVRWSPLVWKLAVLASVLLMIAAVQAQVILANNRTTSVASCVNDALGVRNPITTADQVAHTAQAEAQHAFADQTKAFAQQNAAWVQVIAAAVNVKAGSDAASEIRGEFKAATVAYQKATAVYAAASARYATASADYQKKLSIDQAVRNRHPLGKC